MEHPTCSRLPVTDDASGGGSAGTGWEGAPFPAAGTSWRALGAPIPSTIDPGRAEQTRPMASRSFVQWRAPPGRHEPRPLHRRVGRRRTGWELGEWWEGGVRPGTPQAYLREQHQGTSLRRTHNSVLRLFLFELQSAFRAIQQLVVSHDFNAGQMGIV